MSLKCFISSFCVRSPFAHRSFTTRSTCPLLAFIVHSFAFCVRRALAFTVNKAFRVRWPCLSYRFESVRLSFCARVCARIVVCIRSQFTVYISFTNYHSVFTHRSLCVRSAFAFRSSASAHRSNGKVHVERFRDWNTTKQINTLVRL